MWQGAYHPTVYWPGAYFGRTGGSAGAVYHEAVTLAAATGLSWASVALCATVAEYAASADLDGDETATAAVAWALAASAALAMLGTTPSLYTYAVVRCAAEMLVASLARDHIVGVAVASSERLDPIDAEE